MKKRFLTLLLVVCLVLSCVAPAMAVQPGADTASAKVTDVQQSGLTQADNKVTVSKQDNSMIVSGEAAADRADTVRDHADFVNGTADASGVQPGADQAVPSTNGSTQKWNATPIEQAVSLLKKAELPASVAELQEAAELYAADEQVAAFVVMEDAPLAEIYSQISAVPADKTKQMESKQDAVIAAIEAEVLNGGELTVNRRFTYLTNAFSITTAFGNLEKIALLDGVKSVFLMPVFHTMAADTMVQIPVQPNTASSGEMSDVPSVWEDLGITGAGMTIAIIDTGLDLDHPSFAAAPADPAMDVADIEAVLEDLNAYEYNPSITAQKLYRSEKVPYAFNYVDASLTADHSRDDAGDHGTHVAGIAAANKVEGIDVVGMAPDAQLVVMKVFGANGGAYMDDIVAALEDAMMLDVDVVNMSLGTSAGFTTSSYAEIDAIYANIAGSGTIVNASAGNDGTSAYGNMWGTNMNTTSNPDNAAVGSPSTYANVNSIASVDNALVQSNAICVSGEDYMYNDAIGLYVTFDSLAGEDLEYVMVPGLGNAEDFEGLDVAGKVAVISRGIINFSLKLANAEANGAIGVLITNNEPGSIANFGMKMTDDDDNLLDGVSGVVPCALISMDAGEALAANAGGTFTVYADIQIIPDEAGGQMSSFSSWGPGVDLSLVPDMAGVGGNVTSTTDNGTYSVMSGTSMSAPQVSGMASLVASYLKSKGIAQEKIPAMATALMMSTAVPVVSDISGNEASPRQQGAGLVNVLNAVTAESYLTVAATENSKPKAELGSSAEGTYSFTFTVNNFGAEAKTYTLDGSVLTEGVIDHGVEYFMAGYDVALNAAMTFSCGDTVTVAAGESVDVTVTVALSEDNKTVLETLYPAGAYVEGFVYLNTEDGVDLSLPYLGFYGDWSEPAAFDTAYWYDNSFWVENYDGLPEGNEYYHVFWTRLYTTDWVLGMNPYVGAMFDEDGNVIYDPANNIISNNGDNLVDNLNNIYISLMRNAESLFFTYTDEEGNVVYEEESLHASKTMYLSSYGQIVPYVHSWWYLTPWDFTDANGDPLPHGTKLTLTIKAVLAADGAYKEQTISLPLTIDVEAPEIDGDVTTTVDADGNVLMNITIRDDNNPAYAAAMNAAGTQYYTETAEFTDNGDGTHTAVLDVTDCGSQFMLVLADYGANESYFDLTLSEDQLPDDGNKPALDTDALYAYRVFDAEIYDDSLFGWITIDKQTAETTQLSNDMYEYYALTAAEYVDGYIFAVDAGHSFLVVEPGLWNRTVIRELGVSVLDMTFNKANNTMYVSTKAEDPSGYGYIYTLSTLDLMTGELSVICEAYDAYELPYAMAATDDGTIYAIKYYNSYLYTVDPETGEMSYVLDADGNNLQLKRSNGSAATPYYAQSMTYSSADERIYWSFFTYTSDAELFTIDVRYEIPTYKAVAFPVDAECVGLLTLDEDEDYTLPEAESLSAILLNTESLTLLEGTGEQLSASLMPWNYVPTEELVWSSNDETVATVDANGVIAAVAAGRAEITASCEGVSATCVVNVVHTEGTLYAYDYYNHTNIYEDWIAIDLSDMSYTSLYYSSVDFWAADYNGHDGYIYGYDGNGQFYRMDPATGDATALGTPNSALPTDMAYDYSTGFMYAVTVDQNAYTSTLYYVNMTNGALVEVATAYDLYMTLACDTEGALYAISSEGVLYYLFLYESDMGGGWMPLSTEGESTMMIEPVYIMEGLGMLQYAQSMCFDHNNRVLLWASPENTAVYWIDIFAYEPYMLSLGDPTNSGIMEFMGLYTIPEEIPELAYVPVESVTADDMLLMVGGSKNASVNVKPLNATNQTITLASEDETIATVSNGTVTGVAEGTTTIDGTLTDGENTFEFSFTVAVKASAGYLNGYVASDLSSGGGQAWAVFSDQDPTNDIMYPAYCDYMLYAEEYVDGKLYAYGYDAYDWEANFLFMVIDAETYEIEGITDMGDGFPFVYDMSYDYTTGTMYAVAGYNDNSSDLYMVNLDSGELIKRMDVEPFIMSLAVSADGTIYGASASTEDYDPMTWESVWTTSMLYTFDVVAGTYTEFMDTGVLCNKLASMAFDYDTGNLYWTAMFQASFWDPADSGLYLIDLEGKASYDLGVIGPAGSQMTGLYIIAEEYPETPNELFNITLTSTLLEMGVGETKALETFVQPAGYAPAMQWNSSDETIATVDEDGIVTAVAPGKVTITVTVEENGKTFTSSCVIVIYGELNYFLIWNNTDSGFTKVARQDSTVTTNLTEGETEAAIRSMTMVDDKIYGYDVENNFFVIEDTETFARTYLGTADLETEADTEEYDYYYEVRDLAWDGERLLAVVCQSVLDVEWEYSYELMDGCAIYEVDPETGALTYVTGFTTEYGESVSNVYAMTVDADGIVYIYSSYDDYVSSVDLETGVITRKTTLQNQGVYGGSDGEPMAMDYDPLTGNIYLLFTTNGAFYQLFSFNAASGQLSPVGFVGNVVYDEDTYTYDADTFSGLIICNGVAETEDPEEPIIPVVPSIPVVPAAPAAKLPFTDVQTSHWFYDDVKYVFTNGLMNGISDTEFGPNLTTTRAMIVTVLWRLEGEPTVKYSMSFNDVASGTWYTEAVRWAASEGIVNGMSADQFAPNKAITREQLVTILYRYAIYKGMDISVGENTNILSYNDAFGIAKYAIPAMQWACGEGLVKGDNGNLMPAGSATRAQVAAILHRFCENVG